MKIICIGRNYVNHVKELKNDMPKEPIFFLKPDTAIQPKSHPFFIPHFSNDIHYEVELVVRINKTGKHIEEQFAHKYYAFAVWDRFSGCVGYVLHAKLRTSILPDVCNGIQGSHQRHQL